MQHPQAGVAVIYFVFKIGDKLSRSGPYLSQADAEECARLIVRSPGRAIVMGVDSTMVFSITNSGGPTPPRGERPDPRVETMEEEITRLSAENRRLRDVPEMGRRTPPPTPA